MSLTEKRLPAIWKNAFGPLWAIVTVGAEPSLGLSLPNSARASSARRRS